MKTFLLTQTHQLIVNFRRVYICYDTTTLSITTFSITSLSITSLSLTTFSIRILSIKLNATFSVIHCYLGLGVTYKPISWVSICRMSLCWISLCWLSWRQWYIILIMLELLTSTNDWMLMLLKSLSLLQQNCNYYSLMEQNALKM